MRVLAIGLDGADHDLVQDLLARGRLPTVSRLAREGTFGPLRSTLPAFTPTAWSSFLTGLNPGGHGIFGFRSNPSRRGGTLESAATRAGTPLWRLLEAADLRSAYVTIPFTHPPESVSGVLVTGFGGPQRPEIVPLPARNAILAAHPDLVAAPQPTGWGGDYGVLAEKLVNHVDQIADVCFLCLELEPDLALLCVDFMSSDIAGHLAWHRLDSTHPAHAVDGPGDELVRVYEAVDRACGALIEQAEWLYGEEPAVLVLSDHGMKPTHWLFRANRWLEEAGYLRYRPGERGGARPEPRSELDEQRLLAGETAGRAAEPAELDGSDAPFAEIDTAATRAYSFGYGGQIYLGEETGAIRDRSFARELADALAEIAHPETGEPAFEVRWKDELFRGAFVDKGPELMILPRDERIHVDSSRRLWPDAFARNERPHTHGGAGFSGHHARTGILAAAGPGIQLADVPEGSEITQMPATLLALHGVSAAMDAPPLEAILDPLVASERRPVAASSRPPPPAPAYSKEDEARMIERLRELGYE